MKFAILALTAFLLAGAPAWAVEPNEMLKDPALEARARVISQDLRCLVCQNQSIDDSNAGLARDLRILVRERLLAGDSNSEVVDFVVDRYGDYVLLDPPFKASTLLLWLGPLVIMLLGAWAAFSFFRSRRGAAATAGQPDDLTFAEQARLHELLAEDNEDGRSS